MLVKPIATIKTLGQERAENFGCVEAMSAMASLMKDCGKVTEWARERGLEMGAEIILCQVECSSALSLYVLAKRQKCPVTRPC